MGKQIKKSLIDKGMTASELASTLGTTPQYLNKIIHGERVAGKYEDGIRKILELDILE